MAVGPGAAPPAYASSVPDIPWAAVKCVRIPEMVQALAAAAQTVAAEINEMIEDGRPWVEIVQALRDLEAIQNEMLEGAQHYAEGNCEK
jgi:hypothetical protein